jgi:hypothetical protein
MRKRIALASIPAIAVAAFFGTGCEVAGDSLHSTNTSATTLDRALTANLRITGGGRIDPAVLDKTTFGFTVDGTAGAPIRGQLQTVFHFPALKAHSVMFDAFEQDTNDPNCIHFRGMVRTSDGHIHRFRTTACDEGEPGSSPGRGPDMFGICIDDHRSTDLNPLTFNPVTQKCDRDPDPTPLTGGNIQLH